ncbi:histidine phosphatase family protein, partial [Microbacteriaceae bacterium K1510]|nr:histidine phosphatase family protein [Microbacteriaceae bacterium K1510]
MNQLYIVRHCQAEGQHPDAPLTAAGRLQAEALKSFFSKVIVDRIISTPFARAQESVRPLAKERGISVQLDERLAERVLSAEPMPDWLEKLRRT